MQLECCSTSYQQLCVIQLTLAIILKQQDHVYVKLTMISAFNMTFSFPDQCVPNIRWYINNTWFFFVEKVMSWAWHNITCAQRKIAHSCVQSSRPAWEYLFKFYLILIGGSRGGGGGFGGCTPVKKESNNSTTE